MSAPTRVRGVPGIVFQWVTDGGPCDPMPISEGKQILIEVRGNLSGPVAITGSLIGGEDMPALDQTKKSPWFAVLPPVSFIQPVTESKGVTIYLKVLP